MNYFLFFSWLIVLSWGLTKIRFVKNAELGSKVIIALFICKVAAGIVAGWLAHKDIHSDTWNYHNAGLIEYHLLFTNPKEYFTNLFYSGYSHGYDGILQTQNSFWNDLKDNLIIKLVSVLHIFSGGSHYINVVLYNFIIFFGGVGLYRVFNEVYQSNKLLIAAVVFLLPSILFFGSTIHKDGLILALIGVLVFNMWYLLHSNDFSFKRIVFILLSLFVIFLFRNFVVMALLPALTAWIISEKKKTSPIKTFATVYIITLLLFFTIQFVLPSVNLQAYIVQKQADFFSLEKGNTTIQLDTLKPNAGSFAAVAPVALQHGLLRPFITDVKLSKMLLPLSIELIFYELLVLLFIFFRKKTFSFNHPFLLFSLFFGLSLCLIIGYTVPVIGAIVRYRSIYLPFILAPFLLNTDWYKVLKIIHIK